MIWRDKKVMLLATGAVMLANLLFFFTYRVQYEQRVDDLHARFDQAQAQLDAAKSRRIDLQSQLEAHDRLVSTIDLVFTEWWSTPDDRLTTVITEVQSLGVKSGLVPRSMSFSSNEESGRLGTTAMGISFNVEGTYDQSRRLINLIELSDQFLIIDSISLREAQDGRLGLNLVLKTLFHGEARVPDQKPETEG